MYLVFACLWLEQSTYLIILSTFIACRSAAVEADFDDEDFELDDIEATENESRHHQDTSVDREEEILAGDSLDDDDEVT